MDQVEKHVRRHRASSITAASSSPAPCARSSPATPTTASSITFSGDDSFLHHPAIASVKNYNGRAEIILRRWPDNAADAQALLANAVDHGTRISRFEVMEPTLEEIFIDTVGVDHADFDAGSAPQGVAAGGTIDA